MNPFFFDPLTSHHFPLLHQWMQKPHVAQWWGERRSWSFQDIQEKYSSYVLGYKLSQNERKPIFPFVIQFEGRPIGFIQMYNPFDFEWKKFSIKDLWNEPLQTLGALDFYIGDPAHIGKGLGTECLKVFLRDHVFRRYDACLVDPEKSNKIALKTYAKAGFSTIHEVDTNIVMVARKGEKKNPIIIFGSSRSDGHTLRAIQAVIQDKAIPIVDLRKLNIAPCKQLPPKGGSFQLAFAADSGRFTGGPTYRDYAGSVVICMPLSTG